MTRLGLATIAFGTAVLITAPALSAQDDVVELGRRYGTPVPASYFELLQQNPDFIAAVGLQGLLEVARLTHLFDMPGQRGDWPGNQAACE